MPLTVRVFGDERPRRHGEDGVPSITLDAPRILLGRGEGCDIRLPDPTVSHRHLSVRQRGSDYVLVDEGSTNGTRVGKTLLSAQAPRTVRSPELVRIGKTWVELVVCADPPSRSAPQLAKEIALDLVVRSLEKGGEDGRARVRVEEGASAGSEAAVPSGEALVIGRARDAGLFIDDADASRRHVEVRRRGDVLVVRDLGSRAGSAIGGRVLGETDAIWRRGEPLRIAGTTLSYVFEAAEALAELERQPDVKVPLRELQQDEVQEVQEVLEEACDDSEPSPDTDAAASDEETSDEASGHEEPQADVDVAPKRSAALSRRKAGQWSLTDFAVVLLALGVFSLSAVGYWVLLK